MGDKSSSERHIRKLTKVGGKSYAITIPIEMIRGLGWRERQKVTVIQAGDQLIIRDWS